MKTIHTTKDISTDLEQVFNSVHDLNAKLVAQMHAGVAHFYYYKKGKKPTDPLIEREAYGTLSKSFLERILGPTEDEVQPNEPIPNSEITTQRYWDIEAGDFRAFTVANLIAMF